MGSCGKRQSHTKDSDRVILNIVILREVSLNAGHVDVQS